jgi:hypothetical protein
MESPQLTTGQNAHVERLQQPSDIYRFTLLKVYRCEPHPNVNVHWEVTPLDTLFEHNGLTFSLVETLNGAGDVIEDVRTYTSQPWWPFNSRKCPPEYVHYPCTIIFENERETIQGPEEV